MRAGAGRGVRHPRRAQRRLAAAQARCRDEDEVAAPLQGAVGVDEEAVEAALPDVHTAASGHCARGVCVRKAGIERVGGWATYETGRRVVAASPSPDPPSPRPRQPVRVCPHHWPVRYPQRRSGLPSARVAPAPAPLQSAGQSPRRPLSTCPRPSQPCPQSRVAARVAGALRQKGVSLAAVVTPPQRAPRRRWRQ